MDEVSDELKQIADHLDAMLLEHKGELGFRITKDDAKLLRDYLWRRCKDISTKDDGGWMPLPAAPSSGESGGGE